MQKPSNAKGTRDFSPEVVKKREHILNTIKRVFEKYGFVPLQTPAIENLSTLTGKYGAEGDKLLFKILNSGDISRSINSKDLTEENNPKLIHALSEKGLRYDLTVPFARYVVQHRNEITFPFRRYQIQEVWRADKPQKGRYREFTQCDADIIGSDSLINEADLLCIYDDVFRGLGFTSAILKINHRKFLEAMVDELELNFPVTKFTSTLDKLDKIGKDGVIKELETLGVAKKQALELFKFINESKLDREGLDELSSVFNRNSNAQIAINQLHELLDYIEYADLELDIRLDLSLARGLDYYTGCIFEATIPNSGIGSVSGGGRYDDLTSVFGLKEVSGVGISFGIDRLFDIMDAQKMFENAQVQNPSILICHFDDSCRKYAMQVALELRKAGVSAMVFPDLKNIKKQFTYADKINASYCITIGEDEMQTDMLSIKDMQSGTNMNETVHSFINSLNKS